MRRKVDEEKGMKCPVCTEHFEYKETDIKTKKTWLPLWLGGYEYFYVVCPSCGEILIIGGMR